MPATRAVNLGPHDERNEKRIERRYLAIAAVTTKQDELKHESKMISGRRV